MHKIKTGSLVFVSSSNGPTIQAYVERDGTISGMMDIPHGSPMVYMSEADGTCIRVFYSGNDLIISKEFITLKSPLQNI
jgi:hypothetical protein